MINDTTLVIGHRNPDMDAIASAVGYAWLLNERGGGGHTAARVGEVNAQTAFALNYFQMKAPLLVSDVRPRVRDVIELVPALRDDVTLREASRQYEMLRRTIAVLDQKGDPKGLVSAQSLFGAFVGPMISDQPELLTQTLTQAVTHAMEPASVVLQDSDYITQALQQLRHNTADDYVVIDGAGHYVGLCSPARMLTPPHQRLILVDHNEASQSVAGIEEAEVIEVLDHHRVGSIATVLPIRFCIEPVGSCSTLVAEQVIEQQITLPSGIAGLLLSGLLSDTLVFQSVTTTPRDQKVAYELARMAALPGEPDEAIRSFGQALLMAGAGMGTRSAKEILEGDLKFYETERGRLAMSQVEVTQFEELDARLSLLREAMEQLVADKNLTLSLLMVTDILRGTSRILAVGEAALVAALPYPPLRDGTLDAKDIVSRKKQLVPTVLAAVRQA